MDIGLARVLDGELLARANEIYAGIDFAPSDPRRDATFGVLADGGAIVALGRIVRYDDGAIEIGGFWTRPEWRRRGVARTMVAHVIAALPDEGEVYCVPFDHLAGFYRSFGMTNVGAADDVPADGVPADGVPADGVPADGVPADGVPAGDVPASIGAKRAYCQKQQDSGHYQATTVLRVPR